ncbi:MAG: hypothetical protein NTU66_03150 [Elusimicrobia bacterium]|nr:hypothetical protein [Elusimicrobiota bacterium]
MSIQPIPSIRRSFRYIFLVQNREFWQSCPFAYDKEQDLVLTFDFAVRNEITSAGGICEYIDHIVDPVTIERYNYETYQFFSSWHLDAQGNDMLRYRGYSMGRALRIELWNELTYYPRLLINLRSLETVQHEKLFAGISDVAVTEILPHLAISSVPWTCRENLGKVVDEYYFPIQRWMQERVYGIHLGLKARIKQCIFYLIDILYVFIDVVFGGGYRYDHVFVVDYFPTVKLINALKDANKLAVVSSRYDLNKVFSRQRRLRIHSVSPEHRMQAEVLMKAVEELRPTAWHIDGIKISDMLYRVFIDKIRNTLAYHYAVIDSIELYFKNRRLTGMLTAFNLGIVNCLMIEYCRKRSVPVFLIINGLLTSSYLDEAKDAIWINSYGLSMRDHYFAGMNNIVCLGDPRMDAYAAVPRIAQRAAIPVIVIGTAGFNNIDLNSYVAYEFDFLYDILTVMREQILIGKQLKVIIKVRSNGYRSQYVNFIHEYFPDISVDILDTASVRQVLEKADLYLSIYSQTLFEASAMGIPVVYYKKDTEIILPPFDGDSELVTAVSLVELRDKINAFFAQSTIFDAFLSRQVMEQYIGPLDGHNLERNEKFFYDLIRRTE